jgi:alkylhydroperoxidase family enzyme
MSLLDGESSYLESDEFTHREKVALRYCDAIIGNPTDADEELWKLLHEEFTEPELVELGHFIGYYSGGQRWLITLHAKHGELQEFLDQENERRAKQKGEVKEAS